MYVTTVILRRTEKEFWGMTPKKLKALTDAHVMMNTPPEERDKVNPRSGAFKDSVPGYIDQVIF